MHPSPASVAALLLVAAAISLIVLSATAVSPRVDRVPQIELDQIGRGERPAQARKRRRSEHRSTPVPARTPGRARTPAPTRTPAPAPALAAATPAATPVATPSTTPQEAAVAPAAPEPASVVTAYYRALDARHFDAAWKTLTPAVRTAFGGYEHWRTGYATTLASRPHGIAVEREGPIASVAHELVTDDRSPCGPVRRRFAVRWRLVLDAGAWRAASLTAVKRSGPEPDVACAARHDAARGAGGR